MRAVCRDERLERARRGGLTAAESSELAAHLALCPDCRLAWRMWAEFQGTAGARPGDERLVDRAARAALGAMRPPAPRWRVAIPAAAAIVVAAGVASGAIALHARYAAPPAPAAPPQRKPRQGHGAPPRVAPEPPPAAASAAVPEATPAFVPQPRPETAAVPGTTAPRGDAARAALRAAPPAPVPPRPVALAVPPSLQPLQPSWPRAALRAVPPAPVPPPRRVALAVPPPLEPSLPRAARAQRLFAQAVRARNEGRTDAAIASFRELERELTDTDEAMVSLVSVGELLLSRGSVAEALDAFDAYANRAPRGVLAPEALAGRVRALARLGRRQESAQAAAELARRFPDSPYARSLQAPAIDGGAKPRP